MNGSKRSLLTSLQVVMLDFFMADQLCSQVGLRSKLCVHVALLFLSQLKMQKLTLAVLH